MSNLINRVFPVGEYKVWLVIAIAVYAAFQFFELKSDLVMQRAVPLESRREGQTVVIKGTTYQAPVRTEKVFTQFNIHSASEFLLLSNGEADECFLTSFMKLGLAVLFGVMIWQLDFTDPFNPKNLVRFKWGCNLLIVLLLVMMIKNTWTHQWVNDELGVQNLPATIYQYGADYSNVYNKEELNMQNLPSIIYLFSGGYSNIYYMVLFWLVRMVISFYQKGVQNQQELELTV